MIVISYPKPAVGRTRLELPHVPGKPLRSYLRDAGLQAIRNRCAVLRPITRERLSGGYEPHDGETIVLESVGKAMS